MKRTSPSSAEPAGRWRFDRFEADFARWVVAHRWLVIVATVLFTAVTAAGLDRLVFTMSYRIFFRADDPELLAFDALENTYTRNESLLLVLAPRSGDIFTRDTLAAIKELTQAAWQIPHSNRVDSITNFQHTEAQGDDLRVRELVDEPATLDTAALARIRRVALAEPFLVDNIVAQNGRVTAVSVAIRLPGSDETRETPEAVAYARALLAQFARAHPGIDVHLTGLVAMNNAFAESSIRDTRTLVPLSFAVMMGLVALFAGGLAGALVTFLVVGLSIVAAMGLGGYIGYPVSPPTAAAPTIILTVAIANCVHIVASFLFAMRHGEDRLTAIEESLRVNLQPVFFTGITTAIGFLTMNFSEVPPFVQLGNLTGIGALASFILSVTFLPAMLAVLPVRASPQPAATHRAPMVRLADFVVRHRDRLFWMTLAVIAVLAANIPRNELNDVFLHYFHQSIAFRSDTDFTVANLTGMYQLSYSLDSGASGGISDPRFMREVAAFVDWYRARPEVRHVGAYTDVMKRLNRNMHGDDPAAYRLPEERDLAAQYLLLYEMSLPYGLDLNNQINVDKSSTRVNVNARSLSSNEAIAMNAEAEAWLAHNAPHIRPAKGSGTSLMFARIGKRNIIAMLVGTTIGTALISILLIGALRSVRIGLLSLIPNLLPAAMGFGLWGIFVGEVGLSLSVVTAMTLGIVVDDTVHFLSKYLRARRHKGLDPREALRYAFRTVGGAMVITSVVLVAGFLVLALSDFELNSGMGLLTALVIALALPADFLLLPPLLMKLEDPGDENPVAAGAAAPALPGGGANP